MRMKIKESILTDIAHSKNLFFVKCLFYGLLQKRLVNVRNFLLKT